MNRSAGRQKQGKPPILCVDDEPQVLQGIGPHLRRHFDVHTATSGREALELFESEGPFEVVVSDMRMPGMDGAEFLKRVRRRSPDTTRILLTGYSDAEAAIKAVNDGAIARYLTKPCPPRTLVQAVRDGSEQYRVVQAERTLLEETLTESVKVLTEMLGLVHPEAFGQARRIEKIVRSVAQTLELEDVWEFGLAALLCEVGVIAMPQEVVRRAAQGKTLSPEGKELWESHPSVARRLIERIPRLEEVAVMVERQAEDASALHARRAIQEGDRQAIGAQLLRVALDFDRLVQGGKRRRQAVAELERREDVYNPRMVAALHELGDEEGYEQREISLAELEPGMVLLEDVVTRRGAKVVPKGHEVSSTVKERLQRFHAGVGLMEPLDVLVPVG